jgi:hypothetical protein
MKTLIRSVLFAGGIAIALGVSPASAQVYQEMTFKTTFPFMVGRTMLPAGSYTVRPALDGDAAVLQVRGDGGTALFLTENAGTPRADPKQDEVVFTRTGDHSGDHYVLSEIWDGATREGADAVPTRGSQPEKAEGHQVKK